MSYCSWFLQSEIQKTYHEEWGTPVHDDRLLFEFMSLELMQCGLSFALILKKRETMRACFENFDFDKVAACTEEDIARILNTEGMIRSERKIRAVISNAAAFQKLRKEQGTFASWLWSFTGNKTLLYKNHENGWVPSSNGLSEEISRQLKKRGFKFMGPVVVYSYLQACGLINDHDANCPCRSRLMAAYPSVLTECFGEKGVRQYTNATC